MNIVSDNGNKYVLNSETNYSPLTKYGLWTITYTIINVPIEHPIALLNINNSNIAYAVNNSDIIEIKVSGGQDPADSNGDYFTFTDSNDVSITLPMDHLVCER